MSFNFSELQQKADKVLHNSDEAIRKWIDFISAPAGTVSLQYYDQNGNLQTVSFSNRNKLVQDFIANANSAMSKTFYVDSVNGNDNNDGSSSAPFKTIKKAVDSVPTGGFLEIGLKSDVDIDGKIKIVNKSISIIGNGHKVTFLYGYEKDSPGLNSCSGFSPIGSCNILFNNLTIDIIEDPNNPVNGSVGWDSYTQIIKKNSASNGVVFVGDCTINLPSVSDIYFASLGRQHSIEYFSVKLYHTTVNYTSGGKLITCSEGGGGFFVVSSTLNGATAWSDVISGIVKDASGIPRNIISNIVL